METAGGGSYRSRPVESGSCSASGRTIWRRGTRARVEVLRAERFSFQREGTSETVSRFAYIMNLHLFFIRSMHVHVCGLTVLISAHRVSKFASVSCFPVYESVDNI